jgi:hypothetical protein
VLEGDVGGGVEQRAFYDAAWARRLVGPHGGRRLRHRLSKNVRDGTRGSSPTGVRGRAVLRRLSRGAYTARSLAGLVRNAGILRPEEVGRIGEAYELYRDRDGEARPEGTRAREFRARHAVTDVVPIKCVAVFDTVGSLGVPTRGPIGMLSRRRNGFHDVTLSGRVEHAFHALAIDERRKPFAPTLWEVPDADARERGPGACSRCGSPACTRTSAAATPTRGSPTWRWRGCTSAWRAAGSCCAPMRRRPAGARATGSSTTR